MYLEAFNSSVIRYLLVDYKDAPNDSWLITISTILSAKQGKIIQGTLVYQMNTDVSTIQEVVDVNATSTDNNGEVQVDFSMAIPKVDISMKLWS